jgi:ferredoxin
MKTQIFYFSGTGNSLRVAHDLAFALGDTEVTPMSKAIREKTPVVAGRVGFVFPVYMWGLPAIVDRFCRQLEAPSGTYCFAAATCGGSAGGTLTQLKEVLKRRGLTLSLGRVIRMPGNYTPMYGAPAESTQRKLFDAEKAVIPDMVRQIAGEQAGQVDGGGLLGRLLSKVVYRFGMPRIAASDVKFKAEETCDGCGLCARVCPVENIVLQNRRPMWRHHCEQCMACLQWCPREAIQFGARTAGRKRYRHPDFKARDFIT